MDDMGIQYQVDEELLKQITDTIVDVAHPIKILLFGSRARGDERPDSDLDLMVIMDKGFQQQQKPLNLINRLYRETYKFKIPEDIVLFDVEQVEHWKDCLNHVIGKASSEGRVLYEKQ
jgi:uncharacterized protein